MPERDENGICRDEHGHWSGGCSVDAKGDDGAPSRSKLSEAKPSSATKSAIAKQAAKRVGADIQQYAEEHCEPILAHATGGTRMPDNEPEDVRIVKSGKLTHGLELKVMVDNKANKITMKRSAMDAKAAWQKEHNADFHTVVFDDQKVFNSGGEGSHDDTARVIYYRRGFGSFRVDGMYKCKDVTELNSMINMPVANLPKAAKPAANYYSPS